MKNISFKQLLLLPIFILWIGLIFFDFINKHPFYSLSLKHFSLYGYSIASIVLALGVGVITSKKSLLNKIPVNGLTVGFLFILFCFITIVGFGHYGDNVNTNPGASGYIRYLFRCLSFASIPIILFLSSTALGSFVSRLMSIEIRSSSRPMISNAIGIALIIFLLFILSALGLLKSFVVLPLFFVPILLDYKRSFYRIKSIFVTPLISSKSNLGFWSGFIFGLLLMFLAINYVSMINPFPSGFDSRNYYVNISKLLVQEGGLIEGFQPYNWSLLMSIGYFILDTAEVAMVLSFAPFIYALVVSFDISKNYLKLPTYQSLLILLLVSIIPAIANQMFIELKIDFGLLYIQLCIVILFFHLIKIFAKSEKLNWKDPNFVSVFLVMSILSGFAMGIKLTHLYLVFAMVILLWSIYCKYEGFVSMILSIGFVMLASKLDDLSGMRAYHIGVDLLQWLLLGGALVLSSWSFYKYKSKFVEVFKISVVFAGITILVFVPWMVKNYSDSNSLNPKTFMIGTHVGPDVNLNSITRNYNRQNK